MYHDEHSARPHHDSELVCRLHEHQPGYNSLTYKSGQLPQFIESETVPELDALLSEIRSKILVPSYLKEAQRKLVFKTKNHQMLLNEPFWVDVGDDSVQLTPLDKTKDIPATWKSFSTAMQLMGDSPHHWQNLNPLLEGIKVSRSGKDLKSWQQQVIVKTAGNKGMAHIVLEGVRSAERTGLRMRDVRVAREVLWACRMVAVLGEWSAVSTDKAVRYSTQIATLMDEESHCGGKASETKDLFESLGDPRRQPDIIGAALELAAVRADLHLAGEDTDDVVAKLTERLMANIERDPHTSKTGEPEKQKAQAAEADYQLERWVPVLSGLQAAKKLLSDATPHRAEVDQKIQELREKTMQWRATIAKSGDPSTERRRGAQWFDALET